MMRLALDRVGFSYPGEATLFEELSLDIPPGQWVGIVGPSGAGKTTLAKMFKGLLAPGSGKVLVDERPLVPGEINHEAACLFANPENQMISPLVAEEVAFGLEQDGMPPAEVRARVAEALALVGLQGREQDATRLLSGGEQQRLLLAAALAQRPRALILDDALAMVDGWGRYQLLGLLAGLQRRYGFTLVQCSHHLEDFIGAERLVALAAGRLAYDGAPAALLRNQGLLDALGLQEPAADFSQLRFGGLLSATRAVELCLELQQCQ